MKRASVSAASTSKAMSATESDSDIRPRSSSSIAAFARKSVFFFSFFYCRHTLTRNFLSSRFKRKSNPTGTLPLSSRAPTNILTQISASTFVPPEPASASSSSSSSSPSSQGQTTPAPAPAESSQSPPPRQRGRAMTVSAGIGRSKFGSLSCSLLSFSCSSFHSSSKTKVRHSRGPSRHP